MEKNKFLLPGLAAFLLSSVGFSLFSIVFVSAKNISRRSQLARFTDLQKREVELLNLEKQYGEWKNAETEFSDFRKRFFIRTVDFPQFRSDLNSFLTANQLKPNAMSFQTSRVIGEFARITLAINVNGSYASIRKFIYDVEHHPKMMFFRQLQMSSGRTAVPQVGAKLSLEVYLAE